LNFLSRFGGRRGNNGWHRRGILGNLNKTAATIFARDAYSRCGNVVAFTRTIGGTHESA